MQHLKNITTVLRKIANNYGYVKLYNLSGQYSRNKIIIIEINNNDNNNMQLVF